jgi:hypothetical protein
MIEDIGNADCLEFQNHLFELVARGVDLKTHPHVKACDLCSALVHDLYRIAEDARLDRFGTEE